MKYLLRNFGLTALGLCLLASAVEVRGAVHDYKRAELEKFELTLKSVETMGQNASAVRSSIIHLAEALPVNVETPLPIKPSKRGK